MQLAREHRQLVESWQRGFPLEPRPYAAIGAGLGLGEARVLEILAELKHGGVLSRVGATVRPNTAGASLLAAMRVAPAELDAVAAIVSREPCVNHNYEREHELNLWFVVAAADRDQLSAALARLRAATGHTILELPLERAYYLDLGFSLDLASDIGQRPGLSAGVAPTIGVAAEDRRLLAEMEQGLELVPEPYAALARRCGLSEAQVIERLERLIRGGIISRLGLIVRHRALGISANAMAVWDVPDGRVDQVGPCLAAEPFVSLCYRRPRHRPEWSYNLFAMVHGRERATVERQVAALTEKAGLEACDRAILFSRRCFVQRGATFKAA